MPFSNVEQIAPIMAEIDRIRPQTMIDVGCGLGVYGLLCRIQLDLYWDDTFYKKLFREHRPQARWNVVIDAIEGFPDYLDYIPRWVYNEIIVADVRTALPEIASARYDLALALAILEHLPKEDGRQFIRELQRISRVVILSVPKQVAPQCVPGNEFETHRSQWSQEDFLDLGFNKFLPHAGAWIAVCDPALPAYSAATPLPAAMPVLVSAGALENKLDTALGLLQQTVTLQQTALDRLSIKYRLKTLLSRLLPAVSLLLAGEVYHDAPAHLTVGNGLGLRGEFVEADRFGHGL